MRLLFGHRGIIALPMSLVRAALLGASLAALSGVASAHPGHALSQTAYLTLAPGEIQVELDLMVGEDAVAPLVAALDPGGDGTASNVEAQARAETVLSQVKLVLDGQPASWTLTEVDAPDLTVLSTGSGTLQLKASAARLESPGLHTLEVLNDYASSETLKTANVFLAEGEGWTWDITDQSRTADGAGLTVTFLTIAR
jgi:hypothetical protein